jgi:hypothetical protein
MDKQFKYAGVATKKGQVKVRFCNDLVRIKVLDKDGDKNINFIELPRAMTKPECVTHLRTVEMYALLENKVAIDDAFDKYCGVAVVKSIKLNKKTSLKKSGADPVATLADLKVRAAKVTS